MKECAEDRYMMIASAAAPNFRLLVAYWTTGPTIKKTKAIQFDTMELPTKTCIIEIKIGSIRISQARRYSTLFE